MPKCQGCGFEYAENFKFCPQCARPAPEPERIEVVVRSEDEHQPNTCPICRRIDQIEKVKVIYQKGHLESSTDVPVMEVDTDNEGRVYSRKHYETIHGVQESSLSTLLKPPEKPAPPAPASKWGLIIWGILILLAFFGPGTGSYSGNMGIWALMLLGALFLYFLIPVRNYIKNKKKIEIEASDLGRKIAVWEAAMRNWQNLYFCHRDGVIYLPEDHSHAHPEEMMDYIFTKRTE